jgi:hypothetical protein
LQHVQNMLGHADAKTTSIYLNVVFDQLAESARRFPGPQRPARASEFLNVPDVGRLVKRLIRG